MRMRAVPVIYGNKCCRLRPEIPAKKRGVSMKKMVSIPVLWFLMAFFLISWGCAPAPSKPLLTFIPEDTKWVAKTLAGLSLDEKVGQMVSWFYSGRFANEDSDFLKDLEALIRNRKLGGMILFGGEVYETAFLTNRLQKIARIPLLIASDLERGAGNQVTGATLFPPLMAIGAADSEELAYQMGRITALEGRALGIHVTYAPVVDVNINPDNPIINTRAIGEDPDQVSRLALAFIRGCQENGMIATAKHFPGHGDTAEDSHTLLPTVAADRNRIDNVELYTFKKAVEGGVQSVMTAHLHVPALDPTPGLPATLSPVIMTDLLRRELGFKGIIVTDAMDMGGITRTFGPREAAVRAVQAGVDMLLLPTDVPAAIEAVVKAVKDGAIPEARINDSVRRILAAKSRLGLHRNRLVEIESLPKAIASKEYLEQAARTFESAVTLVKNEENIVPLSSGKKLAVLSLSSDAGEYFAGRVFVSNVLRSRPGSFAFYADPDTGRERFEEARTKAAEADVIIIALFSTVRAHKGSVGLEAQHVEFIKELAAGEKPLVVISFGSPYLLRNFPDVEAYLCAYRNAPAAHEAAAKAIFGEIEVRGKLPVSIPGLFPIGHGITLPKK